VTVRNVADVQAPVVVTKAAEGTPPVKTFDAVELAREVERLKDITNTIQRQHSAMSHARYRGMLSTEEDNWTEIAGDGDEGDVIDLMLMDEGVIWRFVFQPDMDEDYPWHDLAPTPVLRDETSVVTNISNTSYATAPGVGTVPLFTVPVRGFYACHHWSTCDTTVAGNGIFTTIQNGAVAASDLHAAKNYTGRITTLSRMAVFTVETGAGEDLEMNHRVSAGTGTIHTESRGFATIPRKLAAS
jgi:hypothetical protein